MGSIVSWWTWYGLYILDIDFSIVPMGLSKVGEVAAGHDPHLESRQGSDCVPSSTHHLAGSPFTSCPQSVAEDGCSIVCGDQTNHVWPSKNQTTSPPHPCPHPAVYVSLPVQTAGLVRSWDKVKNDPLCVPAIVPPSCICYSCFGCPQALTSNGIGKTKHNDEVR